MQWYWRSMLLAHVGALGGRYPTCSSNTSGIKQPMFLLYIHTNLKVVEMRIDYVKSWCLKPYTIGRPSRVLSLQERDVHACQKQTDSIFTIASGKLSACNESDNCLHIMLVSDWCHQFVPYWTWIGVFLKNFCLG